MAATAVEHLERMSRPNHLAIPVLMDWTDWDNCNQFAIEPSIIKKIAVIYKHLHFNSINFDSEKQQLFCTYNCQSGYSKNSWKNS